RSTGHQGFALAEVAAQRGARVTLVAANTALPVPDGVQLVPVETTAELQDAVRAASADADAALMAAAVADFRPAALTEHKIKTVAGSGPAPIELVETPDILAGLVADRPREGLLAIGFAAETGDDHGSVLEHGRAKA